MSPRCATDGAGELVVNSRHWRSSIFFKDVFRVPIDPAVEVTGFDIKRCATFNSNAVPLKLCFTNRDPAGRVTRWVHSGLTLRVLRGLIHGLLHSLHAIHR